MANDWKRDSEEAEKRTKRRTSVIIASKLEFELSDDKTYTTLKVGKEVVKLDYWDWYAFKELTYDVRPEKPEEVVLKKMTENGGD
jgi:hypothetical protein